MLKLLSFLFILSISMSGWATDDDSCETGDDMSPFEQINQLNKHLTQTKPYYFFYKANSLEDLQEFKNCLEYVGCGTFSESIVDDPKDFRYHAWRSLSDTTLNELMTSCPIQDLKTKLLVRQKDQKGAKVDLKAYSPNLLNMMSFYKNASPAVWVDLPEKQAEQVVASVGKYLKANEIEKAQKLILSTWKIDLHDYKLNYTGAKGGYAVTLHDKKTIEYGRDWISEPCDLIRMIRHEAEHVAQWKKAKECGTNHNYKSHLHRERTAHLNDARFIDKVCPNATGINVKNACLNRFRTNYMRSK